MRRQRGQSSGRPRQPEFVRQTIGYGNRERDREWEGGSERELLRYSEGSFQVSG